MLVNQKVETQNPLKLVLPKGLLTDQQKKRRRQTSSDQDGSQFGGYFTPLFVYLKFNTHIQV